MKSIVAELRRTALQLALGSNEDTDSSSWSQAYLSDLCDVNRGKLITKKNTRQGNVPVVAGGIKPAYYHDEYNEKAPVITVSGSGANAGFINFFNESIWASDCSTVKVKDKEVTSLLFIYYSLKARQDYVLSLRTGMAIPHVYPKDLLSITIPLPPLPEQQRIVAKVDTLMQLCDQLEEKISLLGGALDKLKQAILQLAVEGKLVPQDSNDQPASQLLKEIYKEKQRLIKTGKIRKSKLLPPVTDEEKPFDIPGSWEWVRLGEVTEVNLGKTPSKSVDSYWRDGCHPWVTIADMIPLGIVTDTKTMISSNAYNSVYKQGLVPKDTLLISFKLTIGRTSILGVPAAHNEAIASLPFYMFQDILTKFLLWVLPILDIERYKTNAVKGATLNKRKLQNLPIPLPPLAEQKRIARSIDELIGVCSAMEVRL